MNESAGFDQRMQESLGDGHAREGAGVAGRVDHAVAPFEAKAVEVTPAMIEAGVHVLVEFDPFFSLSPTLEEILVREILHRALSARLGDCAAGSACSLAITPRN